MLPVYMLIRISTLANPQTPKYQGQDPDFIMNCLKLREKSFVAFFHQTSSLLHLTVGTMALLDERERAMAKEILQAVYISQLLFIFYESGRLLGCGL